MSYSSCFYQNGVKYSLLDNQNLIIGDNSSNHINAIESGYTLINFIVSEFVDNASIEEIGRRAFS